MLLKDGIGSKYVHHPTCFWGSRAVLLKCFSWWALEAVFVLNGVSIVFCENKYMSSALRLWF